MYEKSEEIIFIRYLIFVYFDALHPSQQYFSHVVSISCLPGLNQYLAADKVIKSRTQHINSACGECRADKPSIPSLDSKS